MDAAASSGSTMPPADLGDSEVVVMFSSKLPDQYQVPPDPMTLPARLARYGLSEVVNHLLGFERPVPFDFLVDGEFLRTSVAEHLSANGLSSEKTLRLEYTLALSAPEPDEVDQAPDWISGVAAVGAWPSSRFAATSYDGTLRLYEGKTTRLVARLSDHPHVALASLEKDGLARFAFAGKDGAVRCCAASHDAPAIGPVTELRAPSRKAVQAVAMSEDATLLASGGWDAVVRVWNADSDMFQAPSEEKVGGKRQGAPDGQPKVPKFELKGHSQVVTCLLFGAQALFPFTLFSGSWDSGVRVWDTAAASCICNWTVARAVTSMSTCTAQPAVLATSHEDGHVSLWDVRAPPHPVHKGALQLDSTTGLPLASAQTAHRRLASQLAWCPGDPHRLASVGHDGMLSVLDPRSPRMPLVAVRIGRDFPTPTKLLCLAWLAADRLAVGDSDGRVSAVTLAAGGWPPEDPAARPSL